MIWLATPLNPSIKIERKIPVHFWAFISGFTYETQTIRDKAHFND